MVPPVRRAERVTLLDGQLQLCTKAGPTACRVRATARPDGSHPVVLVVDSSTNAGLSVHLVFDVVVEAIQRLLPNGLADAIWVHRWDERAIASVLLRDHPISRDHIMVLSAEGWEQWPIPGQVTSALLT